jgi:hypothetical protein
MADEGKTSAQSKCLAPSSWKNVADCLARGVSTAEGRIVGGQRAGLTFRSARFVGLVLMRTRHCAVGDVLQFPQNYSG